MDLEVREIPIQSRGMYNSRLKSYKQEMEKIEKDFVSIKNVLIPNKTNMYCVNTFIGRFLLHINTRTYTRDLKLGSSTQNPPKVVDISTVVNSECIFCNYHLGQGEQACIFCEMSLFSYS